MSKALFERRGESFVATELSLGPWNPHTLHGGPPSALVARAIEEHEGGGMFVSRITVELLRPLTRDPLTLAVRTVRPGKKVQLVEATLRNESQDVLRALGLRIRQTDVHLPDGVPHDEARVPPLEAGAALSDIGPSWHDGFHNKAVEHRFVRGEFLKLGPSTDWIRLTTPLLEDEETSPLCRVVAVSDFGNGISAVLGPTHTFINPDLTVALHRYPRGEWVCLDARSRVEKNGVGMSESRLFDQDGPIGRAMQCLIVEERRKDG